MMSVKLDIQQPDTEVMGRGLFINKTINYGDFVFNGSTGEYTKYQLVQYYSL